MKEVIEKIFLFKNKLIISNSNKKVPPIFKPAKYPLLGASLPFLKPNIKNIIVLKINSIKLVMVELTPSKLSILQIIIIRIKNIA